MFSRLHIALVTSFVWLFTLPISAYASSQSQQIDVTPEMVALFQATPPVSPERAADCRYANEARAMIAGRHDVDIRKAIDGKVAKSSKMKADVWAIVLVREARLRKIDPATVMGPFQKQNMQMSRGAGLKDYDAHIFFARECDKTMHNELDRKAD